MGIPLHACYYRVLCTKQSCCGDLQASVTAITDWMFAWEAADPDWKPQLPDPFARALGLGMKYLKHETILCDLILTLMCYLDSQQKWRDLAPRALRSVLVHLCASMTEAAKLSAQQYQDSLMNQTNWQYNSLAAASRSCSSHLCIPPGKLR